MAQAARGDVIQHMIGQAYFLRQDWHLPLLVADRLVAPAGTNIAMTDSIPLEALFLKALHIFFPGMQQGITLFLALCWCLQPICAVFALRSMGEKRLLPAIAVSLLSACFPTFLARTSHTALCAHWILLLAIGLYFRAVQPQGSSKPTWVLAALTSLTLLVHPYLMVMVGALLGAIPLSIFFREKRWKACRSSAAATLTAGASILLAGKVLGYWGGASGGGYGIYSMNLASPFWPAQSSLFLQATQAEADATGGQYEGYQYLGAGLLFLLAMLFCRKKGWTLFRQSMTRNIGLLLACLALTVIALSNRIYFFHTLLFQTHIMVPGAEQMRSSGRMFWPVAYVILLGAVWGVCKVWPRGAPVLLSLAAILQWVDTRDLRQSDRMAEAQLLSPPLAADSHLFEIMHAFEHVEIYPRLECDATSLEEDMPLIYAAAYQNASVNTMYTARSLPEGACHLAQENPHYLDDKTLIVLNGPHRLANASSWIDRTQASCGAVNTLILCAKKNLNLPSVPSSTPLPLNQTIFTSSNYPLHTELLESGWSGSEDWGTWNEGRQAFLFLPVPKDTKTVTVILNLQAAPGETKKVKVSLHDQVLAEWSVSPEKSEYSVTIPTLSTENIHLKLDVDHPVHLPTDPRFLGIGISSVKIVTPN